MPGCLGQSGMKIATSSFCSGEETHQGSWPMENQKEVILITGGSGLIGQQIARFFSDKYQVVALDIKEPKSPIKNVNFVKMDVSDKKDIDRALEEIRLTYGDHLASVIHLAAFYSFDVGESELYDKITVKGTEHFLEHLQQFSIDQFIFSSTMLVHAPGEVGEIISELSPVTPKWAYPLSKVKAENVIKEKRGRIPCLIFRIAGVYDDRCHSIPIANHIERINEHHITSHFFPGNLDKGQAFVHMDDLVEAFGKAVERRKQLPDYLELIIGEQKAISFREFQNTFGQLIHGKDWRTQKIPRPLAWAGAVVQERVPFIQKPFIKSWMVKLADDHYELDIEKAFQYLGWKPQHDLKRTLPKMISFLKSDPVNFYKENKITPPISKAVNFRKSLPVYAWFSVIAGLFYAVTRKGKTL